jgi:hypothetical protein
MAVPNSAQSLRDKSAPFILSNCDGWYAVHTLPFAERGAEGQLQNQGFRNV